MDARASLEVLSMLTALVRYPKYVESLQAACVR
jgi:hypothetical protein